MKIIIFACICILFVASIHISLLHLIKVKYPSKLSIIVVLLVFPFYVGMNLLITDEIFYNLFSATSITIFHFITFLSIYIFFYLAYLFTFATINRSISWKLLMTIENTIEKKINEKKINDEFIEQIKLSRLRELEEEKYIIQEGAYYRLALKGRIVATLGKFSKNFIGLR